MCFRHGVQKTLLSKNCVQETSKLVVLHFSFHLYKVKSTAKAALQHCGLSKWKESR